MRFATRYGFRYGDRYWQTPCLTPFCYRGWCKCTHSVCAKESRRFTSVSVKDAERHRERCAHLPHQSLKDANLYFEITKVCGFEKSFLHLSGFCVGGAHISHNVFQHLSRKQEQNRHLELCVGFLPNFNKPSRPTGLCKSHFSDLPS